MDNAVDQEAQDDIEYSTVENLMEDLNKNAPDHPLTRDMNRLYGISSTHD